MTYRHIGIVGLGLMGGSLALKIRQHFPTLSLFGVDPDRHALQWAIAHGIVNDGAEALAAIPQTLDVVIICTPIETITPTVKALTQHLKNPVVLTDIGSVKGQIVENVPPLSEGHVFIPGHPMAGIEKNGIQYANPNILTQAPYVLVPQNAEAYEYFKAFLTVLQFRVVEMSAAIHDEVVAYASHVPYVMACLTVKVSQVLSKEQQESLKQILGPGFRDTTRVAGSSPKWGSEIARFNKEALKKALSELKKSLENVEMLVEEGSHEKLTHFFQNAQNQRAFYYD